MGKNYPKFIMIQLILYITVKRKKRATINNVHNTEVTRILHGKI